MSIPGFFNLFSEGEPFAAILIAHGTHVFWGVSWDPKVRNSRAKAESGREVLGEGAANPLHTS